MNSATSSFRSSLSLLVFKVVLLSVLLAISNVIESTSDNILLQNNQTENEINQTVIQEYEAKICNHSSTCYLLDVVPVAYRDLRKRDCMCDEKCFIYGDCCKDSKFNEKNYKQDNFSCIFTKAEGYIYMKASCPQSWNESTAIKHNCESQNTSLLNTDVQLSTPVTNVQKGITYRNLFCAICHGETEFEFWNLGFSFNIEIKELVPFNTTLGNSDGESAANATNIDNNLKPTLGEILSNARLNDTSDWFWTSTVNNKTFSFFMHGTLSLTNITEPVRHCVPDVISSCPLGEENDTDADICSNYTSYTHASGRVYKNPECMICNGESNEMNCETTNMNATVSLSFTTAIRDPRILKINHCEEIPVGNAAYNTFCLKKTSQQSTTATAPATAVSADCFPTATNVKPCLINSFFKIGIDFVYIDNETIYLKGAWNVIYPSAEWVAISNTTIYVCGHYIPKTTFQNVVGFLDDWATEILIKISIVCLILHLLFFQQLPEMKNLSGKTLAAFCFTLLIALLCFEMGPRLPGCRIMAAILHFALISCFVWMLIMSYDCWLSLYRATKKFRSAGGKHEMKFLIYCTISLTVPTIIVGVSVYFELASPDVIACALKPAYGLYDQCFIGQVKALYLLFFLPATCMFLANIAFFAHTAFMIYFTQRKTVNPNTRSDFQLYTKLALMMGLTWILGSLTTVTGNVVVGLLFSVFNMSQGIFIFFFFTFKQKTLRSLKDKHKNNSFISNTLSTFVSDTPPAASSAAASTLLQTRANAT